MCIAIVKPKGVVIPEEHLENGWKANDDGAGFACITTEGEFIIHKSMTYEGFIDIYRQAVEAYGETSDFLIHFRITSKGATTLSNCHPFVIDEDRVLIHNGTLYNIHIDKEDNRSDTRVFAEDWLANLPKNWEDNEIINYMVEDFIGTSKMCMLHKTKGVFIFNPDKGVWDEGIWYSNKTYKKSETKTTWYNNYRNDDDKFGFYSFKWDRFVTKDEAAHMTKTEIADHTTFKQSEWTGANRFVSCAICEDFDRVNLMMDMHSDHPCQYWCYDCYAESVCCDICGVRYQEKDVDEYYDSESDKCITLCDKCVPYLNQLTIEKSGKTKEEETKDKKRIVI